MAKVPYKKLLTEAISEFDTSKTSEVKGPFLDPILSWDGGGELPTNKPVDAGSILERYYFKEKADEGVNVGEADYSGKDDTEATSYEVADEVKGKSTDHTMGAGTEQAGTHEAGHDKAEKREEEIAKEDYDLTEDLENSIIEKIISEMEEEDVSEAEDKFEGVSKNAKKDPDDKFEGVAKDQQMPDEKEMKDPEEHSMGAGTPQAGTGDMEGEVPDRKDVADKMVKPHNYSEAELFEEEGTGPPEDEGMDMDEEMKEALDLLEMEEDDDDDDDKEEEMEEGVDLQEQEEEAEEKEDEKELDVDEKMSEFAFPGGPTPHQHKAKHGADGNAVDVDLNEAFKIFQEQMDEEEDEEDEKDED